MILLSKVFLSVLMLFISPSQTLTQEPYRDPPAIIITADSGATLPYSVGLNIWYGAVMSRTDTFGIYEQEHRDETLPFVPLGDIIHIVFDGDPPDSYTLHDFGYGARRERRILPLDFVGGRAAFALTAFPEDSQDAMSVEFDPDTNPRGFLLVCAWGDNECEYGFLLTTEQ